MSTSETPARRAAASLAILLTGAFVTVNHARWIARGVWCWPMVLGGLAISAGAVACGRRRPNLAAVIATQGMLFAVLFSQAFAVGFRSLAFGLESVGEALVAMVLAFGGLALSLPLLAPGSTESTFAPLRYRRFLLLGAIGAAAASAFELTAAQYFVRWGIVYGRPDFLTQGSVLGVMGVVQAAAVMGLLRMRGIALLGGIAASVIGAVWTVTTGHFSLIPHIGCAALASIAWAIPLILPRVSGGEVENATRTRVCGGEEEAVAEELDAGEVVSTELHAS